MTTPYDLIDLAALDLTSEAGKENAITATITSVNSVLTLLNNSGSTVPLLGAANTGGLLTASQKLTLTGGGNADSLHTHSGLNGGGGGGGGGLQSYLTVGGETTLANSRVLRGVSGQITVADNGPGLWMDVGLATSGAVAGSYTRVTVDNKGRVVSGSALLATDIPAHQHSAADLTSGVIPATRYGTNTVPMGAINAGSGTDGWIVTKSGLNLVLSAAPSGTGEVNTVTNVGTAGTGLFRQKTGANLEFYNIEGITGILVAADTPNLAVSIRPDFGTNTNQVPRGDHTHDARYYQKSEVDNLISVLNVQTKTGAYSATSSDQYIRMDTTSGAFSVTLPTGSANIGKVIRVKRVNTGSNVATVAPTGTDKIDLNYPAWQLRDQNEYVVFVGVTGGWETIDSSGTLVLSPLGNIGASMSKVVTPTDANFSIVATVNNGVFNVSNMSKDQTVHIQLSSGAGGFKTLFGNSGQGANRWSGGTQPDTTIAVSKIDDVYATYDGTSTFWSFRGQAF